MVGVKACATADPALFDAPDPGPAISLCNRCPVLFACRWWAYNTEVSGVVGGVTEQQREQWRAAWNRKAATPSVVGFLDARTIVREEVRPGRGGSSQIVTDLVAARTARGESAQDIADAIGTTQRTVVRYRARSAS